MTRTRPTPSVNHDGINDIVIGAQDNIEGGSNAGAVYIVWGGVTGGLQVICDDPLLGLCDRGPV